MKSLKNNFFKDIELKNLIMVYGNIYDYNYEDSSLETIQDNLFNLFSDKRKKIITYDYLEGIGFIGIDKKEIVDLVSLVNKNKYSYENNEIVVKNRTGQERIRNTGDAQSLNTLVVNKLSGIECIKNDFFEIREFSKLIYEISKKDYGISFFIYNGDNIFGKISNDETLNRDLKQIFDNLMGSIENINKNVKNGHQNIIISSKKLSNFPSALHLDNPKVSKIQVQLPTRKIKEKFVVENLENFNIQMSDLNDFIDKLEGLTLVEIEQIGKLSKFEKNTSKSYKQILNQFKYGSDENPWEEIRKEKIANMENILAKRVKGQNLAIEKVSDIVVKAYVGISGMQHSANKIKPKGTLFFVGPTGVGKTELAKSLAEFLFGDESACIRFDMSEYNSEHSDQRLIGAPPGYVGYEAGGQLTNKIKEKPFSVILFDEIEKAHKKILDKFLQILEDGRLTDGKGETVYFSDCIIIFTSNIGTDSINSNDENSKDLFKKAVKDYFKNELGRPEILNRIGEENIVAFDFIKDKAFLKDILLIKLENIKEFIKEKYNNATIEFENKDEVFLQRAKNSNIENGGRGALNDMENYLINPLSKFLFHNENGIKGKKIVATFDEDLQEFEFRICAK